MALTILTLKDTFNLVTGKIVPEDLTDYATQGVDFTSGWSADGFLRVTYNVGAGDVIAYDNLNGTTPDVDPATSQVATADISIPLGTDGFPIPASYTVSYRVVATDGATTYDITQSWTYEYGITNPTACLSVTHSCSGSAISSDDITEYSITGTTIVSQVRVHTLTPPPSSGQSAYSANLKVIQYAPLWTDTWTAQINTTITYLQSDGLYVTLEVIGSKEHKVVCDQSLATILCCLFQVRDTYNGYLTSNQVKAANYKKNVYDLVVDNLGFYFAAIMAADYDKAAVVYDQIIADSGCGSSCACNDGVSVIVQATSSGTGGVANTYIVDSPDGSLTITQQVNGAITTYHAQLSAALQLAIANAGANVTLTTTTPTFLDISNVGSTWTIDWRGGTSATPNTRTIRIRALENLGVGGYMTILSDEIATQGNIWDTYANLGLAMGRPTGNNAGTDYSVIYLANLFLGQTTAPTIHAHAQIMRTSATFAEAAQKVMECEVNYFTDTLTGNLRLRIYDPASGQPYLLSDIAALLASESLYIAVTINAKEVTAP